MITLWSCDLFKVWLIKLRSSLKFSDFSLLELSMTPTSLKEISARVVKTCSLSFGPQDLPRTVIDYLLSANCCVNPECKGEIEKLSPDVYWEKFLSGKVGNWFIPRVKLRKLRELPNKETKNSIWARMRNNEEGCDAWKSEQTSSGIVAITLFLNVLTF